MRRALLGFALVSLAVAYVELRLPSPASAQGRDAVYERLAVSSTAANALRVAGGLEVGNDADVGTGALSRERYRVGDAPICAADGHWRGQAGGFSRSDRGVQRSLPRRLGRNGRAWVEGRIIVGLVSGGTLAQSVGSALTNRCFDGAAGRRIPMGYDRLQTPNVPSGGSQLVSSVFSSTYALVAD